MRTKARATPEPKRNLICADKDAVETDGSTSPGRSGAKKDSE